jgi:hypothetical protein
VPWFKVDDSLHAHAKVSKVTAEAPAALGLWLLAGSWCSANLTDGFVPDHKLPWLFPDAVELAPTLVAAGLWRRKRGGYQFHDWHDYNPTSDAIKADRNAARERMRKLREERKVAGHTRNGSAEQGANVRNLFATPPRTSFRSSPAPRAKCERHAGQHADSCGQCRGEALGGA